jgi:DNA-binding transcriptional regulator YhcF (GntR family)
MIINPASRIPKHVQTAIVIKQRIGKGEYAPGLSMPPVRMLGAELGVSSNVIHRAVRLLEKEGIVETQHGVGVRVLDTQTKMRAPLRLGMVHPYTPDCLFAGAIHCYVDKALDLRRNHCVVKSCRHDAIRERQIVLEFVETGVEGLLVWPCESDENAAFFSQVSERVPLVFVDRRIGSVAVPSVVLDYSGLGCEVVTHLGSKGYGRVLILEDPLPVSSYREMYTAMRETVSAINAEHRFDFVRLSTSEFVERYSVEPMAAIDGYRRKLGEILSLERYDAVFSASDEFLDYVFINTDLGEAHRSMALFSLSTTLPSPRSPGFYRRTVCEWISDFGQVVGKASEILHDMMYLRNHPMRQHRVKFSMLTRGMPR